MAADKLTTQTSVIGQVSCRTRYCHGSVNKYQQAFKIGFLYLQKIRLLEFFTIFMHAISM